MKFIVFTQRRAQRGALSTFAGSTLFVKDRLPVALGPGRAHLSIASKSREINSKSSTRSDGHFDKESLSSIPSTAMASKDKSNVSSAPVFENATQYLEWLRGKLGFKGLKDWYHATSLDFAQNHGSTFLEVHRGAIFRLLSASYPDHVFLPWFFRSGKTPIGYFSDRRNRQRYIDWVCSKLAKRPSRLVARDLEENHGSALLKLYKYSLSQILESLEIQIPTPRMISEAREFLAEVVGPKLGIASSEKDVWSTVPISKIIRDGGFPILEQFEYSLDFLLSSVFADSSTIKVVPKTLTGREYLWYDRENVRAYLDWFGESLGIPEGAYDHWLNLSLHQFLELEPCGLLESKNFQMNQLLKFAYPDHEWNSESFLFAPKVLPSLVSISRARQFAIKLGDSLGIKNSVFTEWYKVPFSTLAEKGHHHLAKFDFSRFKFFSAIFPEHVWHLPLFKRVPKISHRLEDKKKFGKYLEEELKITSPEMWYNVSPKDLASAGVGHLFRSQMALTQFIRSIYPNISWEPEKMAWSSLGWSKLRATISLLFPGGVVNSKDHFTREALLDGTSESLHDRIFVVPSAKLIFEYNGPIAFAKQIIPENETLTTFDTDILLRLASSEDLTPISVPFWWDRSLGSLLGTIFRKRSDLFQEPGPLASHKETEPISDTFLRKDVDLNQGYLRRWADDPRFGHLFTSERPSQIRKELRKLKREKKRLPKVPKVRKAFADRFLSEDQYKALEEAFAQEENPNDIHRSELADRIGVSEHKVKRWFVYQRLKQKQGVLE